MTGRDPDSIRIPPSPWPHPDTFERPRCARRLRFTVLLTHPLRLLNVRLGTDKAWLNCNGAAMITVLGGALVNLVPTSDETMLRALPGGSAFNIAIGTARRGFPTALVARFSRDAFGQMLRRHAERVGVDLSAAAEAYEPTTIALMPARPAKSPRRSLYLEGTASREWSSAELALIPAGTTV